jgi:hypothetical protein
VQGKRARESISAVFSPFSVPQSCLTSVPISPISSSPLPTSRHPLFPTTIPLTQHLPGNSTSTPIFRNHLLQTLPCLNLSQQRPPFRWPRTRQGWSRSGRRRRRRTRSISKSRHRRRRRGCSRSTKARHRRWGRGV